MTNEKISRGMHLAKYLPWAEQAFLIGIAAGLILQYFGVDLRILLNISIGGLAVVFYLYTNLPVDIEKEEGKKYGFTELLGWVILPKVLWIGTSVTTAGVLFYYLHLNNHSYFTMIMVGVTSIIIAVLILCGLYFYGIKQLEKVLPILYRTVPALFVGCYIIFIIG